MGATSLSISRCLPHTLGMEAAGKVVATGPPGLRSGSVDG
jgi:hypothetical protein